MRFVRAEGLRKYFSEFGEVEDCTILRDQDGRSRGFAFLTFKEPASVNAVMCREHVLDGKTVRHLHILVLPARSLTVNLDRPEAGNPSRGTSPKHPLLRGRPLTFDDVRVYADLLLTVRQGR